MYFITNKQNSSCPGKVFPPSLSHRSFYNPLTLPGYFSCPTFALVLLAYNLLLSVHPLAIFKAFSSCYFFRRKLFLTIQIKIMFSCFDVLSYLLLFPTIILSIISYSLSSLIDCKFHEDSNYSLFNTQLYPQQLGGGPAHSFSIYVCNEYKKPVAHKTYLGQIYLHNLLSRLMEF